LSSLILEHPNTNKLLEKKTKARKVDVAADYELLIYKVLKSCI